MFDHEGNPIREGFYLRAELALCGIERDGNNFLVNYLGGRLEQLSEEDSTNFSRIKDKDLGGYKLKAKPRTQEFINDFENKLKEKKQNPEKRGKPKTRRDYGT